MTRKLPEWIGKNDDEAIPPRVKDRMLLAQGACKICTREINEKLKPAFDHIIAICNGGANRQSNLQVLCVQCHKVKTRADVAEKKRYSPQAQEAFGDRDAAQENPVTRLSKIRAATQRNPTDRAQMIALLDNGQDLDECGAELGCEVGQLLTPLTRYRLRNPDMPWAIDNGFFAQTEIASYLTLLERERQHHKKCLFVTLPDVVGCARRTLEVFEHWRRREALRGWKLALVCQDGQEHLPIPWNDISAVFIGGSTNWKCSDHVTHIIKAAQALQKWVHVGRVNHPARFDHFEKLGVDSIDGTGISRYTHMRQAIANRHLQQDIFHEKSI